MKNLVRTFGTCATNGDKEVEKFIRQTQKVIERIPLIRSRPFSSIASLVTPGPIV